MFLRLSYCLLILALGNSNAHAALRNPKNFCKVIPVTNSIVRERSVWIQFPNGGQVVVVGHIHGDRGNLEKLIILSLSNPETLSNSEFEEKLHEVEQNIYRKNEKNQSAIGDLNGNVDFLFQFLQAHSEFNTIADEAEEGDLKLYIKMAPDISYLFKSNLTSRGVSRSESEVDNILLGAYGLVGPFFKDHFSVKDPFLNSLEYTGFEDKKAGEGEADVVANIFRLIDQLYSLPNEGQQGIQMRSFIANQVDLVNESSSHFVLTENDFRELREQIQENSSGDIREVGLRWFDSAVEFIRIMYRRNDAMARRIIESNKNVVLFIGKKHLPQLTQTLINQCKGISPH